MDIGKYYMQVIQHITYATVLLLPLRYRKQAQSPLHHLEVIVFGDRPTNQPTQPTDRPTQPTRPPDVSVAT